MAAPEALDLVKYGAIGISAVCLLLAFRTNQTLAHRAATLPPQTLQALLAHARWTMKFSFACLVAAIAVEAMGRLYLPVDLHVGIVPSTLEADVKQLKSLRNVAQPVRLQLASDAGEVTLKNGFASVRVSDGATMLVYVDAMWSTVKDLDGALYGQQQLEHGAAGMLEPQL